MRNLFNEIEIALANIREGWTSPEKAFALASTVIALRPAISCELGVFCGKGVAAMAMAHKAIGFGRVIGVDPWSAEASKEGQLKEDDKKFWTTLDHEMIYNICKQSMDALKLNDVVELVRMRSDQYTPPDGIGLIRIDGNHGPEVLKDVKRYAPKVIQGGILFCDDKGWTGNFVDKAADWLRENGWRSLYMIEDTEVFQKL